MKKFFTAIFSIALIITSSNIFAFAVRNLNNKVTFSVQGPQSYQHISIPNSCGGGWHTAPAQLELTVCRLSGTGDCRYSANVTINAHDMVCINDSDSHVVISLNNCEPC